ncbi:hypothetical protein QYE76_048316 [Lolium multiflorum]|uniref:Retrotransposon gag domain-containing protein n=1 Tax=Lolium multiflorum TaxID=4521 RepID=A0AAD8V7D1_LOLMU|nr:hypothetical protein QYE76_048316 [Lolium multiflorum]
MTEATTTKRKGATEAGASRGSSAESPRAEDRLTGPLADLPCHHPVEAEAEAGDPVPAQSHPAAVLATLGSASTSTDPTTLVQARVWLSDLEENTIFCWFDLKKAFENHFRGTYKTPATTSDLQACIQKKAITAADDDAGGDLAATAIPPHQQKKNRDNGVSKEQAEEPPEDQKGGGSDMVAMTFNAEVQEEEEAADVEAEQAGPAAR